MLHHVNQEKLRRHDIKRRMSFIFYFDWNENENENDNGWYNGNTNPDFESNFMAVSYYPSTNTNKNNTINNMNNINNINK